LCVGFRAKAFFMAIQTFKFKEGTVIVSVSQEVEFDMKTKIIKRSGVGASEGRKALDDV